MTARALEGARHHLQRQRRHLLQQCNPGQRHQQRHHQQGQQPPAAIGQPSAPQTHQQGPQRGQHDHAHRQPQAGLPQSVEQLSHGPAPGSTSSVRRCPARSAGRGR
ncbi:hypothetical protein G6F62_015038 [Rhizopus arrhizus]|nr:hypothetical protein G6F62_015038 [Rhizopus arrhizus]